MTLNCQNRRKGKILTPARKSNLKAVNQSTQHLFLRLDLPQIYKTVSWIFQICPLKRTNTKYCSVESSPAGNGSHSLGSEAAEIIAEEDLELKQTISRSRNPSSDLVIAPDPVLAEVTKASTNNNTQTGQQGMSNFVKTQHFFFLVRRAPKKSETLMTLASR